MPSFLARAEAWIRLPYPYLFETRRNLRIAGWVALLIGLLNAWGMDAAQVNREFLVSPIVLSLGLAVATFMGILVVIEWGARFWLKERHKEHWNIGLEFIHTLAILIAITGINQLIIWLLRLPETRGALGPELLQLFVNVVLVSFLPIGLIIWTNYVRMLKTNLQRVSQYNKELEARLAAHTAAPPQSQRVELPTQNQNEILQLNLHAFLFAKAEGNYIDVFWRENSTVHHQTYRLSIRKLEEALSAHDFIMRPHRSYLINMHAIHQTAGTARNYRLHFADIDHEVPVSRNKFSAFKEAFYKIRTPE